MAPRRVSRADRRANSLSTRGEQHRFRPTWPLMGQQVKFGSYPYISVLTPSTSHSLGSHSHFIPRLGIVNYAHQPINYPFPTIPLTPSFQISFILVSLETAGKSRCLFYPQTLNNIITGCLEYFSSPRNTIHS